WNATERSYSQEQLVCAMVEQQALQRPTDPAVSARGAEMSYGELNKKANQLAHYLQAQGVGPGSYVGIYLQRNLDMIVALLATLKVGAAYLPLDASTPPTRVAFMLREAQATLLITQKTVAARLTTCEVPLFYLEQAGTLLKTQPVENLPVRISPEYPAYIIYTSGSTGNPKGVVINHKALLNMVCWYQETFGVTALDKTTHLANLGFDAAVFEIWPYLTKGALLYLVEEEVRLSPTALVPWLVKRGITISFLPTSLVEMVVNRPWPAQTALRFLLTGGDQLHRAPIKNLPFTLINMYGPTENTVVTTWAPITPEQPDASGEHLDEGRLPVIGRAIANAQVYVLNRAGDPQPLGVPGELFIGGQSLSQGYLYRPDLTAASFLPDPFGTQPGARLYRTGDIVRYLPDGNLEFLGRRDHQVKIRGFRIELGEIETLLMAHPDVREAVVVVSESLPGEKRLAAYVVLQEGASLSKEGLQRSLRDRLPDYMVPTALSIIEELPLTPHGKIDRQALALRRPITISASEKHIAARDAIELQLVHLWERLLGVSPISVTDNFFQLGGHSLTGVRLMSQIQRLFGVDLPLSALFESATIASLATVLRQQEEQITFTPLVEIQQTGSNPPLFCVHPSGGEVLCYTSLAHHLGSDQPMYGLRASDQHLHSSLEEMATAYIAALRTVQPQGPYYLSGWSMGGVVAFEMARQLELQGQKIAFLGLFDSYLPPQQFDENEYTLLTKFVSDLAGMSNTAFSSIEEGVAASDTEGQLKLLLLDAQRANVLPPGVDASYIKRQFLIFKNNIKVLCNYRPQPYAGQITLYRASAFTSGEQVEITYGWHQFARQVHNHAVPGNHYTMLREPQVETLAKQIRSSIEEGIAASIS
ncbi:MAG TPA: amino acid adenylation domain-containing protein, partial [Ktedonobacteraceae bacterium]|nr:amino acid adenylation domain-containing protein [Ktedonobacteraceae bacterium]